jgi:hypothetical protein
VNRSERGVAVLHRLDDHSHAHEVLDVVELLAARDHLLVDGPVVLRTAGDLGLDVQLNKSRSQVDEDRVEEALALGSLRGDHLLDLGIAQRVQHREGRVFELPLHLGNPEPVREGGVDVEALLRDAALLELGQRRDRAHVVETVGELDEQDPDVLGHRHQHLAQRGCLLCLLGVELQAVEFGDAVDNGGHVGAEFPLDVALRHRRVFDRIVKQGRSDGHIVEAEVGEDQRHPERVGDVGLPRTPHLFLVGLPRQLVGALDEVAVGAAMALAERRDEGGDLDIDGVGSPPRQHRAPVGPDFHARDLDAWFAPGQIRRAHVPTQSTDGTGVNGLYRRFLRRCGRPRGAAAPRVGPVVGRGALGAPDRAGLPDGGWAADVAARTSGAGGSAGPLGALLSPVDAPTATG